MTQQEILRDLPPNYDMPIPEVIEEYVEVQNEVHDELRYDGHWGVSSSDTREPANCIGFTNLMSEKLDERNLRHKIGFVNGHAILMSLIDNGESHEQWMFDPLSPKLNQNVDKAIHVMSKKIDEREFAFLFPQMLRMNHLNQGVQPSQLYPWMSAGGSHELVGPDSYYSERITGRLITTLFPPELGRRVIDEYQRYRDGVDYENIQMAAEAVLKMSGIFPDIDIRTHHPPEIKRLVKDLSRESMVDEAEAVTEAFFDSFKPSNDTRVDEYKADCLQAISKISGRSDLGKRAVLIYQELMKRPKASKASIAGKLAISQAML